MEVIVDRCAGLDVHKKSVTASVRVPDGGDRAEQVRTFPTFLDGLVALRDWLLAAGVTVVAMEATGSYWLPVWRVLEEPVAREEKAPFELMLCNARHVKHVPGRKTDVQDAQWLAQLLEAGLLASSFVPPADIRTLRGVTRYRKQLIRVRTSEVQRIEKTLEDAVIKLGAVASSTVTKSGRSMIEALIEGERDPEALADLALRRMRAKIPELVRALDGRFDVDHAAQLRALLDHIDWLEEAISHLDRRAEVLSLPYADLIERLQTIPGVGRRSAEVLVAETGGDMSQFPTAGHLASWAGLCPGHNQSGGKQRSGRRRHGNVWLVDALTEGAWAATRNKDTYLAAKYRRVAGPRPDKTAKAKAVIAVAHKMLIAAYHIMATPAETYRELGADWLQQTNDPQRRQRRLVAQLEKLGYNVQLTPTG